MEIFKGLKLTTVFYESVQYIYECYDIKVWINVFLTVLQEAIYVKW